MTARPRHGIGHRRRAGARWPTPAGVVGGRWLRTVSVSVAMARANGRPSTAAGPRPRSEPAGVAAAPRGPAVAVVEAQGQGVLDRRRGLVRPAGVPVGVPRGLDDAVGARRCGRIAYRSLDSRSRMQAQSAVAVLVASVTTGGAGAGAPVAAPVTGVGAAVPVLARWRPRAGGAACGAASSHAARRPVPAAGAAAWDDGASVRRATSWLTTGVASRAHAGLVDKTVIPVTSVTTTTVAASAMRVRMAPPFVGRGDAPSSARCWRAPAIAFGPRTVGGKAPPSWLRAVGCAAGCVVPMVMAWADSVSLVVPVTWRVGPEAARRGTSGGHVPPHRPNDGGQFPGNQVSIELARSMTWRAP